MIWLVLLACDGAGVVDSSEPSPCDSGPDVTWDAWANGFFATYCRSCHSIDTPDRRSAPEGVDFDSPSDVRAFSDRVRARVIDDESMPVGGGVYPEDLVLLERYLDCSI
ncbi:MAG: hypothetical protein GY913_20145 [Proteobacteria bacterium]|nr:hypothetical protein [Pseudomonadota bacterium]MCP4919218.1 hypothetical protein [Pseudomonadota bacterium]